MALAAIAAVALTLGGCGESPKGKPASQVAAKVNKEEISVHQINFLLQQQRGLKPEQVETTSRQILQSLVDQELALQKAQELKIDREPRVVQQVEAARREIIAREYADRTGEAAPKPSPEAIKQYYAEKPALFKERRIYELYELNIEAEPAQMEGLSAKLMAVKSIGDFVAHLKGSGFRYDATQTMRAAEQLPLSLLDTFVRLEDGQSIFVPSAGGAKVFALVSSRREPVDEERARPAIEQYLLNDAKRKFIDANVKDLRTAAKIEYVGKFAHAASVPAADAGASAADTRITTAATAAEAAVIPKGPSGFK